MHVEQFAPPECPPGKTSVATHEAKQRITEHAVKIIAAFRADPAKWHSNPTLAAAAGVSERTARKYTCILIRAGVLETWPVTYGRRFRITTNPSAAAADRIAEILKAAIVYGIA